MNDVYGLEICMLRPWELNIDIARESDIAIHVQIAQEIVSAIQSGRFTPGVALPGTRDLANKIRVNRKTVIQAYDELIAQGWLTSEYKRGTFVSTRALSVYHTKSTQLTLQQNSYFLKNQPNHHEVNLILRKKQSQKTIHFSEGLPDSRLIPFETLSRAMRHALSTLARNTKTIYGDAKGAMILREAVLQMLNLERGLHAKIDNLCIIRGNQMGLYLIAKALIKAGDYVVFENLTNPDAREVFVNCGANTLNVMHDNEGIDVSHLATLCAQYKIRAVYVMPHHQIPTTVTMSHRRRLQLLALAKQHHFLIIEDDCYHEFSFTHQHIMPIASITEQQHVIYLGSFTNILSPSFPIAYLIASKELIDACAKHSTMIDRHGDQVTELALAELLHLGEIKKHILRTFKVYEERYYLISTLLNEELTEFVSFKKPDSGLAFWLEVHPSINLMNLVKNAELEAVDFVLGENYSELKQPVLGIRLGYANLNIEEIRMGIKRLKAAFLNQQRSLLRA